MIEKAISFQERAGCAGGGKGILIQEEKTGALNTLNNQSVCYRKTAHPRNAEEGQGYEQTELSDTLNTQDTTEKRTPTLVCDARGNGSGDVSPTITGDHQDRVTDYTALCVGEASGMTLGRDRASFNQGKNAQFDFSVEEEKIGAQTAKGPGAVCTKGETLETTEGNKVLRILWETYGAQTVVEWGVGVLDALQQAEVLQSGVHEGGVSGEAENRDQLDGDTPPRASVVAEWLLREMRKQSKRGCASQGRKPSEQFVRQPSETLQELSHKNSPSAKDLFDMWSKGEGLWLLQQALYTIQEIRKSSMGERTGGGGATTSVVRRLTPLE